MSWADLQPLRVALSDALSSYDWPEARRLCQRLIRMTQQEPSPCPEGDAAAILAALRKKRRFELTAPVAEAFIMSGQNAPRIRRQYAQALIEQGLFVAPEYVLQALASESIKATSEVAEAHGLIGRIYKQRYISHDAADTASRRALFERSLAEYLQVYRFDPKRYYWHGINAVALLRRGGADGLSLLHCPDRHALASEILALEPLRYASTSSDAFDLATRLEALIALDDVKGAEETALEYSRHPDADAFEIGSTLRQLEELWQLTDAEPPGTTVLPILRAAKLRREGGRATFEGTQGVNRELQSVANARKELREKNFSDYKMVTLQWYQLGLERARSVARIERLNGRGIGTGWLVQKSLFFPGTGDGLLVLTNWHVVNIDGSDDAIAPDQAIANFQTLGKKLKFTGVLWSSPFEKLDAAFLELDEPPPAGTPALPIAKRGVRLSVPEPLIYIMGHPDGRDLELSLHDNKLLALNQRLLHYRTPTEGGSSGSPVFEESAWEVVALHHAGGLLERLDGKPPPYEANEGIAIQALLTATTTKSDEGTFYGSAHP
jgi:trypsin-like peptidase/tetratricopeptide repeat protein